VLRLRGIEKSYDDQHVLLGVDLDIAPGEICGLLGPNGAGKTTLVAIVAGLRTPDAGSVEVDGVDVRRDPQRARRSIGLAPQDLGLYPVATVRENFRVFGALAGLRRRALTERIDEVAAALSLTPLLDQPAGRLSGGQKRRVHTGIALVHQPPLLLLDEPTVGADVETRADLLALVRRLAADGAAVCYTTHYLPEVEALAASVAVLEAGRVIARGPIDELVRAHAATAVELSFDGDAPALDLGMPTTREGPLLRLLTGDPASTAARALAALGSDAARLRSVELHRPTLETAYLALTGRARLPEGDDDLLAAS
jgi:ABC-2 type transport system ATP-binding protein